MFWIPAIIPRDPIHADLRLLGTSLRSRMQRGTAYLMVNLLDPLFGGHVYVGPGNESRCEVDGCCHFILTSQSEALIESGHPSLYSFGRAWMISQDLMTQHPRHTSYLSPSSCPFIALCSLQTVGISATWL